MTCVWFLEIGAAGAGLGMGGGCTLLPLSLAWCQRIFGTEGPITLSQMLALLQISIPEEGDE